MPLHVCSIYSMHAVHHAAIAVQQDGIAQVAFLDELGVLDDGLAAGLLLWVLVPVVLLVLLDLAEGHFFYREIFGFFQKFADIPDVGIFPLALEMILWTHAY